MQVLSKHNYDIFMNCHGYKLKYSKLFTSVFFVILFSLAYKEAIATLDPPLQSYNITKTSAQISHTEVQSGQSMLVEQLAGLTNFTGYVIRMHNGTGNRVDILGTGTVRASDSAQGILLLGDATAPRINISGSLTTTFGPSGLDPIHNASTNLVINHAGEMISRKPQNSAIFSTTSFTLNLSGAGFITSQNENTISCDVAAVTIDHASTEGVTTRVLIGSGSNVTFGSSGNMNDLDMGAGSFLTFNSSGNVNGNLVLETSSTITATSTGRVVGTITSGTGLSFTVTGTTYTQGGTITTSNGTMLVQGTGTFTSAAINVGTSTLTNSATLNLNGTLTAASFVTSGTATINSAPTISTSTSNTGMLNIAATLGGAGSFSNSSVTNVNASGTLSATGGITNTGTLNVAGGTVSGVSTLNNSGTLNVNSGTYTLSGALTNFGVINVAAAYTIPAVVSSNTGRFNVNSGGTMSGGALSGSGAARLSIGDTSSVAFTSAFAINLPIINTVTSGTTWVVNGAVTLSNTMSIAANTTATINSSSLTNNGTVTNAGTFNIDNTLGGSGAFINNNITNISATGTLSATGGLTNSATLNITGGTVSGVSTFNNSGTLNINSGTFGLSGALTNSGIINVAAAYTIPGVVSSNTGRFNVNSGGTMSGGALSGSGAARLSIGDTSSVAFTSAFAINLPIINTVTSGTTWVVNGAVTLSNTMSIAANTTATFSNGFTNSGTVTNAGTINISAAQSVLGAGTIVNNNALTFGAGASNANNINNNATFNINNSMTNSALLTNNLTMTVSAALSGAGSITNNAAGTLTFATGASSTHDVANSGIFNVTGASTNTGAITNNLTMAISAALSGAGPIANGALGSLTLSSGANVENAITNSGNMFVTGATTLGTTLTNNNNLTIGGNISMAGQTLTSTGKVTVSGQRTLAAAIYTNDSSQDHTITNASTFDSLICTGTAINLTGATVNITSSFTGQAGVLYSWTILSGTSLTVDADSVLIPEGGSFLSRWGKNITGTSIEVTLQRNTIASASTPGINSEIGAVIEAMSNNITNAGQQQLVDGILSATTADEFNDNLHHMIPVTDANQVGLTIQNTFFNKAEARIAQLRDYAVEPIYTAGDVYVGDGSMWISSFIDATNQKPVDEDDGYNAVTGGVIVGFDRISCNDDAFGLGFGYSHTKTNEYSNADFNNKTSRYHGLAYGTHNMKNNNYVDVLITGSYNNNNTSRPIVMSGTDFSTTSNYSSYMLGAKLVRGKSYMFWDSYKVTPLTSIEYAYLNQPSYTETGSVAALVLADRVKNIVTLGAGLKFAFPIDAWRQVGLTELRSIITYDVLNNKNITNANFAVGSSSFSVVSTPAKLALQLGIGFTYCFTNNLDVLFNYDFQMRSRFTENTGLIKVRYSF